MKPVAGTWKPVGEVFASPALQRLQKPRTTTDGIGGDGKGRPRADAQARFNFARHRWLGLVCARRRIARRCFSDGRLALGAAKCRTRLLLAVAVVHRHRIENAQVDRDPFVAHPSRSGMDHHCASWRTPPHEPVPHRLWTDGRWRHDIIVAARQRNGRIAATKRSQPRTPII
jgi:hypothetical protein